MVIMRRVSVTGQNVCLVRDLLWNAGYMCAFLHEQICRPRSIREFLVKSAPA